jgi:hypothetical protein
MIGRAILTFLILFGAFYFGINSWRAMAGKDQWELAKAVLYSIICSVLTLVTLTIFVILF